MDFRATVIEMYPPGMKQLDFEEDGLLNAFEDLGFMYFHLETQTSLMVCVVLKEIGAIYIKCPQGPEQGTENLRAFVMDLESGFFSPLFS